MRVVRGWSTAALIAREEVFDGLITKAVRMTLRPITLNLSQIVIAAPQLVAAGGPQLSGGDDATVPIIVTTAGGQITALWDHYVDAELAPYLQQTFLDSAALVLTGMESALDGSIPQITDSYAQAYLANATNRLKGISDLIWEAVRAELQAGLDDGEDMHQLATRVRKTANVMPGRATVIARTEVHAAAEQGSLAQVQLGGFTDAECSKRWLATNDVKTREQHRKANGQVVGITQPFDVWGEGLQFPGDPTGRAENTIQCRCTMEYLFTDDEDEDLDVTLASWVESQHPRNDQGEFTSKALWITGDDVTRLNNQMRPGGSYTFAQSAALRSYSSSGYVKINGDLRANKTSDAIKTIQSAMAPLPEPVRVQRAVSMKAFDPSATSFTFPKLDEWKSFVGRTFEEPGFLSTTTNENYFGKSAVAGHNVGRDRTMVTFELDVPAGTRAAFLSTPGGPGIHSESELLLDAKTRFTIDDVWEVDGYVHVRGRVVSS